MTMSTEQAFRAQGNLPGTIARKYLPAPADNSAFGLFDQEPLTFHPVCGCRRCWKRDFGGCIVAEAIHNLIHWMCGLPTLVDEDEADMVARYQATDARYWRG